LSDAQRDTLLDICVQLHQRYDSFSEQLIKALEAHYYQVNILTDQAKKRNILRMFTELYFKGLFKEYKRIFKCLLQLLQCEQKDGTEQLESALLLVTDYMKMYGERVFGVLARD